MKQSNKTVWTLVPAALCLVGLGMGMFLALQPPMRPWLLLLCLCAATAITGGVCLVISRMAPHPQQSDLRNPNPRDQNERKNILEGLIIDGVIDKSAYQQALREYQIELTKPYYRVALLPDLEAPSEDELWERTQHLGASVQNALDNSQVFAICHDASAVLVIGTEAGGMEGGKLIQAAMASVVEVAEPKLEAATTVFLGCEVYSPRDLPASYRSAAAVYERSLERDAVVETVNLETQTLSGETNTIFLEELHLMLGYLITSDFQSASRILARVFESYTQEPTRYSIVIERLEFFRSTFTQAVEAAITDNLGAIEAYLRNRKILDNADQPISIEKVHKVYRDIAVIAEGAVAQRRQEIIGPAKQTKAFIDEHYSDPMLDIAMLSERLGFSDSYLSRLFKSAYNQTILSYITDKRLGEAAFMLRDTAISVDEIRTRVGYNSPSTFSRAFHKRYAMSPNQYRQSARE